MVMLDYIYKGSSELKGRKTSEKFKMKYKSTPGIVCMISYQYVVEVDERRAKLFVLLVVLSHRNNRT